MSDKVKVQVSMDETHVQLLMIFPNEVFWDMIKSSEILEESWEEAEDIGNPNFDRFLEIVNPARTLLKMITLAGQQAQEDGEAGWCKCRAVKEAKGGRA